MHSYRMVEKARIFGLMQDKNKAIKLQNAKLLNKIRTLYLEQNFLNNLCNSGCEFILPLNTNNILISSRHFIITKYV